MLGHKGGSVEDQFGVAAPYELGARGAPVIGCDGRWYGSVVQLGSTMVVQKASALTARASTMAAQWVLPLSSELLESPVFKSIWSVRVTSGS